MKRKISKFNRDLLLARSKTEQSTPAQYVLSFRQFLDMLVRSFALFSVCRGRRVEIVWKIIVTIRVITRRFPCRPRFRVTRTSHLAVTTYDVVKPII